jgi:hypothetical protein
MSRDLFSRPKAWGGRKLWPEVVNDRKVSDVNVVLAVIIATREKQRTDVIGCHANKLAVEEVNELVAKSSENRHDPEDEVLDVVRP